MTFISLVDSPEVHLVGGAPCHLRLVTMSEIKCLDILVKIGGHQAIGSYVDFALVGAV